MLEKKPCYFRVFWCVWVYFVLWNYFFRLMRWVSDRARSRSEVGSGIVVVFGLK